MTIEQQNERSQRFINSEKTLLASMEEKHLEAEEDYIRRKKALLKNIKNEEELIERRKYGRSGSSVS